MELSFEKSAFLFHNLVPSYSYFVIYCEKDSHKGIIIGKGGEMLKRIGTYARKDIENFFCIKASVKLWVKVKEDWRNSPGMLKELGFKDEQ